MQNKTIPPSKSSLFHRLIHSKGFSAFSAALMSIFLGFVFTFLIMAFASPDNATSGLQMLLIGGFKRLADVFYFATPILMTGLAVGFAFKMGLFNIGASGQYTMGMFFALYVGFMWDLPAGIHWVACVLAGMIGGLLWGLIPGIFKSLLNVHEVITSIMFNYIGMYLVDMLIQGNGVMYVSSKTRTAYLPASAQLPTLGIEHSNANISIILAIIIAILLYIVLNKTTFGYELRATGFNKYASTYAGMNGKRNIILTMGIAGAMAGLGGAFAILAPSTIMGSSMTYEPINVIAANGFNGIAVALLGSNNPLGIIFSAVFISHIQRGGTLASLYGYKPEIIDIVIAVIIYFSAFAMLMNTTVVAFFKKLFMRKHPLPSGETSKKILAEEILPKDQDTSGTTKEEA
ncbi:MAG TPA: ABC transporter permease [Desulfitobacterium dehalogenans]|uniref:ABC transporter permease n=1 Tax=Desulfitobacterium dehalogenans TaxID=36854 RepID=A0A7C6Z5G6_9FIRM|nr:ABC transporter permease [Desulfitobacterium dehalogenans]